MKAWDSFSPPKLRIGWDSGWAEHVRFGRGAGAEKSSDTPCPRARGLGGRRDDGPNGRRQVGFQRWIDSPTGITTLWDELTPRITDFGGTYEYLPLD